MIENNKKLEEIIYLSLISLFDSVHKNDFSVYYCFVEQEPKSSNLKDRAIYITSEDVVSDKLALARLGAFERKIFDEEYNKKLSKSELNYSKRIKEYVNHVKGDEEKSKWAIYYFYANTLRLYSEQIISQEQLLAAQEYLEKQFDSQKDLTK